MKIFLFLSLLILSGCTSAHNSFIEDMNVVVTDYNDFKKYRNRLYELDDQDLVQINNDEKGNTIYHHKQYDRGFKKYCEYYIVVEPKGETIIGWGFENNATSKYCEIRN